MKRKKVLSMFLACALVATTMAMPVMAAGDTIDVGVTTKTPVLRVTVPTTLAIAVDQLEMDTKGTQISSGAFEMQNNSSVDVKVDIESTADLKTTTKLVASKAAAESSTTAGEAWLAVAAKVNATEYITGKDIKDLTEASENVTTFVQGTGADAAKGKAAQTFYLKKTTTGAYKLLNAGESAAAITYAQFYELTSKSAADQNALDALIKENDVYVATATVADGLALTLVEKGKTHTWDTGETYYTAAADATEKAGINASKLYVYANGTADAAGGVAAFRYIGKLSEKQDSWSKEDITNVHIKYTITGIPGTKYDEVKDDCTYGLYSVPGPSASGSLNTSNKVVTISGLGDGVTLKSAAVIKTDGTSVAMTSGTHFTFSAGKFTVLKDVLVSNASYKEWVLTFSDDSTIKVPVVAAP